MNWNCLAPCEMLTYANRHCPFFDQSGLSHSIMSCGAYLSSPSAKASTHYQFILCNADRSSCMLVIQVKQLSVWQGVVVLTKAPWNSFDRLSMKRQLVPLRSTNMIMITVNGKISSIECKCGLSKSRSQIICIKWSFRNTSKAKHVFSADCLWSQSTTASIQYTLNVLCMCL